MSISKKFSAFTVTFTLLFSILSFSVLNINYVKAQPFDEDTDLSNLALCTLKLARKLHPRFASHRLDYMLRKYDIINEHHHRAVYDAEGSARLFLQMRQQLENAGILTISSLNKWGLPYDHKWCEETIIKNNSGDFELLTRDKLI